MSLISRLTVKSYFKWLLNCINLNGSILQETICIQQQFQMAWSYNSSISGYVVLLHDSDTAFVTNVDREDIFEDEDPVGLEEPPRLPIRGDWLGPEKQSAH